jgi:ABC-2 type transport system permease protein
MQHISKLSPMNWGLEAYYDLFLRGKSFIEIFHIGIILICFALLCLAWSYFYMKKRSWV